MAILLLVSESIATTNVNTDQFKNQFSTNSTSLFFSQGRASSPPEPNTASPSITNSVSGSISKSVSDSAFDVSANSASRAADAEPNYGQPVASVDKGSTVHSNQIDVNSVPNVHNGIHAGLHSNQPIGKRPASDTVNSNVSRPNQADRPGHRGVAHLDLGSHQSSNSGSDLGASGPTKTSRISTHPTRRTDHLQRQQGADLSEHTPSDQATDKMAEPAERWSDWSDCSVPCGIGVQTQRLESRLEFSSIKYKVCKKQVSSFVSLFFPASWSLVL